MGSKTTTTQESKPPAWATPLFERSAKDALALYRSQPEIPPYAGSAVADLTPTTMQGVNQLAQAGQAYDTSGTRPLFAGIGATAAGPLQGMGENPYFEEALSNRLQDVSDRVKSGVSSAGRYGSGAHTDVLTNELGQLSTQALSDQFNQNVAQRLQGLGLAQQSAGAMSDLDQRNFQNRLTGAGATLQAGGLLDDYSQRVLSDEIARYYEAATAP